MRYRRKTEEVEAVQFKGDNLLEIMSFMGLKEDFSITNRTNDQLGVTTPKGTVVINRTDYLIKGGAEGFQSIKQDVFERAFEEI